MFSPKRVSNLGRLTVPFKKAGAVQKIHAVLHSFLGERLEAFDNRLRSLAIFFIHWNCVGPKKQDLDKSLICTGQVALKRMILR
jgi:hypothetical protein